jgi:UDP-N-acetylmuramoylalanine--D-glutamate ligase
MAKRIGVLGAGESGTGAAVLAKKQGYKVFVSDLGEIKPVYKKILKQFNIKWEENKHTDKKILKCDEIIKSPGISEKTAMILKIRDHKIPILSEIEFAGRYTKARTICVTGSNGKTTTTNLIYHIFKKAGYNIGLAGNIGRSFAFQVAEEDHDYYALELSSFQLDDIHDFKPDVAVLTNISSDHLDRYDYNINKYIESKFRITMNLTQDDYFIYCGDDRIIANYLAQNKIETNLLPFSLIKQKNQTAYIDNNQLIINYLNNQLTMNIDELSLKGKHNTYNSMAAGIAARVLELRKETIRESLSDFQGVEHRLEPFIKVRDVEFINDSKATNVNSTWYALESMDKPVVWIAGGVDKGNEYTMLQELVKEKVKAIVCLGKDNSKIHEAFKFNVKDIADASTMEEAVKKAYHLANKGEVVLLSPACASFDLFENYEDRGNQFKACIREL